MSIKFVSQRVVGLVVLGGAGALATLSSVLGGHQHPPPKDGPFLAENGPPREYQLAALQATSPGAPLDMLIIGGGATGTGVAVDAATRGLRVGLVEREDFGAGTSSRSTKLVHGGVRYLEKAVFNADVGQLKLVFHALAERANLLSNAPHLTNALPTMTPCYAWWELPYYWAGLKAYDLVAGRNMLHVSRYVSPTESLELFPTLSRTTSDGRTLKGTVVYYDGQMDDARLNVALATTAARAGACVLNHVEALALNKDAVTGQVVGARVRSTLPGGGAEFDVHAKVVVNATGPFTDSVRQMVDAEAAPMITPSTGVHVVLPDYYAPHAMGLIVPKTPDGRVIFMLPWQGRTVAGTTDASTDSIAQWPQAHEEEVQFILHAISQYLSVRREDVLSTWSGIRPLASDPSAATDTASVSRDHLVSVDGSGLVSITGGKWTTYRSMAEDAVDAAIQVGSLSPVAPHCVTEYLKLTGGDHYEPALFTLLTQSYVRSKGPQPSSSSRLWSNLTLSGTPRPREEPMDTAAAQHLAHAYGDRAPQVAYIAQAEGLGRRLAHGYDFLEAEVAYCARYEYCQTAIDFIARRARLAFLDTHAAGAALPRVVELLAAELKWDNRRKKAEVTQAKAFLETFKVKETAPFSKNTV
eukprot:jgi/Mesen1/6588/ME000338S05767